MGCPTGIDHAVTVVAYTATTDGTEGETTTTTTCEMMPAERVCRGATKQEKRAKTCSGSYDIESFNRKGRMNGCCMETEAEEVCTTSTTTTGSTSGAAYWTIQNSWASGWGDNGFMHLEVVGGIGVSGMNQVIEWITV